MYFSHYLSGEKVVRRFTVQNISKESLDVSFIRNAELQKGHVLNAKSSYSICVSQATHMLNHVHIL